MSNPLPSREQAIELLRKNNCPPRVVRHCEAVASLSLEIADRLRKKGLSVDLNLVEAGALLHDIGRSKTNAVDHGLVGAQIAEQEGLPEPLVKIIKRHVGGGITAQEAARFGWPQDVYVPLGLEEKLVSYADKLLDNSKQRRVPIDFEIGRLQAHGHKDAAERVRKLHEEIAALLDN
ncbi:MAG TPA: HDIG domain-containing protein [Candidatus Limnocylindrales bacterium]|nr:HDIG domain-containing protein [Candidatus Limnocylindrales bacterium]